MDTTEKFPKHKTFDFQQGYVMMNMGNDSKTLTGYNSLARGIKALLGSLPNVCLIEPFCFGESMKKIKLTRGKFTLVDDGDFEWLNKHKWHMVENRKNGKEYATRTVWDKKLKKQKHLYMHRIILKPVEEYHVDHMNGNGLDNRKSNLRACTISQNLMNRGKPKGRNSSQYKGVYWHKNIKKWVARININKKMVHLGCHAEERLAAQVYDEAALKYYKDFAYQNLRVKR